MSCALLKLTRAHAQTKQIFSHRYLLTEQSRLRSVNDIMPMIGARFYTQLDASQMRNDVIEEDLAKVQRPVLKGAKLICCIVLCMNYLRL